MPLLKQGQFADDPWVRVADDADIADETAVVVSLERWQDEADALRKRNAPVAVALTNDQSPAEIESDLDAIDAVFLTFPAYTDGRAYSQARLLRQRYGYKGEIRATGNVLRDQYAFMQRCGFDTFEVADGIDPAGWDQSAQTMSEGYQTAADGVQAIWAKRHGQQASA
ncbi:MAG: DUF934 domain-containing protein [Rhodospirillales bacterium]|nr:DUF934 domain-containing protein [Rhodospirillales bacterium]MBO6788796.1 DUF934 domain-containing protein [Rhodospirillales bacterium]